MLKIKFLLLAFIMILFSTLAYSQEYEAQIQWGPFITDAVWSDLSASYDVADGVVPPFNHAGKLGEQHSIFQLNETQIIIFTFNVASLPFNLAYNLPNKKFKIYTNVYWVRYKAIADIDWSAPSNWTAITYIK